MDRGWATHALRTGEGLDTWREAIGRAADGIETRIPRGRPFAGMATSRALADFKLVPLAVGDVRPEQVAEVLETLWGGPETLIVVSSDLSHYLPYDDARSVDGTERP